MSVRTNFDPAKQDYKSLVFRFRNFLDDKEVIDHDLMTSQTESRTGRWFYGECKPSFGHLEEIKDLEIKHIKLHKLASEIYDLKVANDIKMANEFYEDLVFTASSIHKILNAAEEVLNEGIIDEQEIIKNRTVAVEWDKTLKLNIETDGAGWILFVNVNFANVSGINDVEAIGQKMAFNHHEDMPKAIYNYMIDGIKNQTERPTIIKYMARSGKYFWAFAHYKINKGADGKTSSINFELSGVDNDMLEEHIVPLYTKLKYIEDNIDLVASVKYLNSYLKERNRSYEDFISNLVETGTNEQKSTNKGVFGAVLKSLNL